MQTHSITLISTDSGSRAHMVHNGIDIGISREPLFAAARYLIANQLAHPRDTIETIRNGVVCLSATIWVAARLTVTERSSGEYGFTLAQNPQVRLPHRSFTNSTSIAA
jgi:hypothetical protein